MLICLSCMHLFNKPCLLKPILSKLKSLRCAKLSIIYGSSVVTLQTSNPVNHLTQRETYFPSLAVSMSACRNTVVPISSSLCVLKRCKLWFLLLSHSPLTFTRKETKYKFFIIILLYFRVRYSKTTKFLNLVHNDIRWRQDSTVLAAIRTAGSSAVCKDMSCCGRRFVF